jgi:hypothetical protein
MTRPAPVIAFGVAAALAFGTGRARAVREAEAAPGSAYVAVAHDGRPVRGLGAKDFAVIVGGHDQPVLSAEATSEPLALIIFVQARPDDVSLTRTAIRSVLQHVRQINPDARVGIATTSATPLLFAVTAQAGELDRQIGALYTDPDLGSLVERIPDLSKQLAGEPTRRRILLSVTTPALTHGLRIAPTTAPDLAERFCELWGIEVGQVGGTVIDRDPVFSKLIEASGGRQATVYGASLLEAAARDMTDLFLSQYLVTYARPDATGTLALRIGVRGQPSGLEVYAPGWTKID